MEPNLTTLGRAALAELEAVLTAVPDDAAEPLIEAILSARRIAVYGAGRGGLVIKGFAMRLAHLGRDAHAIGEVTMPPIGAGDLLIVTSGRGDLPTADALLDVATATGATTAIMTARPAGRTSRKASLRVVIPAQTMADEGGDPASILPMGSLFELAESIFLELVILKLRDHIGETAETMRARHTNLE
jgi:6-phospho-3-hexuloisomerase